MSASHLCGLHEPVQTLVNTLISFPRLPQGEKKCLRSSPFPAQKHGYFAVIAVLCFLCYDECASRAESLSALRDEKWHADDQIEDYLQLLPKQRRDYPMIIDSYDEASPAKINVMKNENAVPVDAVIYTFSHEIETYVTENYACEKVGEYKMASGSHAAYVFAHNGKKFGFYKTWVGAPACVAPIEESAAVFEAHRFIHFGGAGCLDKEIARGKVMIPTEAYRDEGTSYHYAPASDYIRIKNWETVRDFMEENKIPYVTGKTWTTDAFYRETVNNFEKHKAEGCISVEMEGSAVQAVCDFRGYEVFMFFTGGDLLDAPEWTMRKEKGQKKHTQHDPGHFEIALALAEYVSTRGR